MMWAAMASISAAAAGSSVSKCGVADPAVACACCWADKTSAHAAIARQVENQCRRVEFMVVVNHDDMEDSYSLRESFSTEPRACPPPRSQQGGPFRRRDRQGADPNVYGCRIGAAT